MQFSHIYHQILYKLHEFLNVYFKRLTSILKVKDVENLAEARQPNVLSMQAPAKNDVFIVAKTVKFQMFNLEIEGWLTICCSLLGLFVLVIPILWK